MQPQCLHNLHSLSSPSSSLYILAPWIHKCLYFVLLSPDFTLHDAFLLFVYHFLSKKNLVSWSFLSDLKDQKQKNNFAWPYQHYCTWAIVYQSRTLNFTKFDALRWLLRPFLGWRTSFWILTFSPGMVTEFWFASRPHTWRLVPISIGNFSRTRGTAWRFGAWKPVKVLSHIKSGSYMQYRSRTCVVTALKPAHHCKKLEVDPRKCHLSCTLDSSGSRQ